MNQLEYSWTTQWVTNWLLEEIDQCEMLIVGGDSIKKKKIK